MSFKEYNKLFLKDGDLKILNKITVNKQTALIIVDVQNDFSTKKGTMYVKNAERAIPKIVEMIDYCLSNNAHILVTRDYHPDDHCSFNTHGGLFAPHCIQDTDGSKIVRDVADRLDCYKKMGYSIHTVYKGFDPKTDSYSGGDSYDTKLADEVKLTISESKFDYKALSITCQLSLTGGYILKSSSKLINGSPDVLSIFDRVSVTEYLKNEQIKNIYLVGFTTEYCVADTAKTLAKKYDTTVILDCCRAVYLPNIGKYGSGFLNDPTKLAKDFKRYGVNVVYSDTIKFPEQYQFPFPWKLDLTSVANIKNIYANYKGKKEITIINKTDTVVCKRSPFGEITLNEEDRISIMIPEDAFQFAFVYPHPDIKQIQNFKSFPLGSQQLLKVGGYIYIDKKTNTCAVNTFTTGGIGSLIMSSPQLTPKRIIDKLNKMERFVPVTLQSLLDKHAIEFCWIKPKEFNDISPNGGFCYHFKFEKEECWIHYSI